jgi:hypothetical protein
MSHADDANCEARYEYVGCRVQKRFGRHGTFEGRQGLVSRLLCRLDPGTPLTAHVFTSGTVTDVVGKLVIDGVEVHQLHFHIR